MKLTPAQEKALATLTREWRVRMLLQDGHPPRELDELVVLGLAERRPVYSERQLNDGRSQQWAFRLKERQR